MLVFALFAFVYALIKQEKHLTVLSGVTLLGWSIWWIIGGGILWYGIGLIIRTVVTVALFMQIFLDFSEEENAYHTLLYIFFILFALRASIQMIFNIIRISSQ